MRVGFSFGHDPGKRFSRRAHRKTESGSVMQGKILKYQFYALM